MGGWRKYFEFTFKKKERETNGISERELTFQSGVVMYILRQILYTQND